jgi:hypothetical protein
MSVLPIAGIRTDMPAVRVAHADVRSIPMQGILVTIRPRTHSRRPLEVQTAKVSRRRLLSVAVLAIIAAAIISWRLWPRDPGSDAPPAGAQASALVYVEPNVALTLKAGRRTPDTSVPMGRGRSGGGPVTMFLRA